MFRALNIIVTIIIIVMNIVTYKTGGNPEWSTFFLGWVGLFILEIEQFVKG